MFFRLWRLFEPPSVEEVCCIVLNSLRTALRSSLDIKNPSIISLAKGSSMLVIFDKFLTASLIVLENFVKIKSDSGV